MSDRIFVSSVQETGRGAYYVLARKQDRDRTNETSTGSGTSPRTTAGETRRKRDKRDMTWPAEPGLDTKVQGKSRKPRWKNGSPDPGSRNGLTKGSKASADRPLPSALKPARARQPRRGLRKSGGKGRAR